MQSMEYIKNPQKYIICNNVMYQFGDDNTHTKGFDGDTFIITYINGNVITTSNLWMQGNIPIEFRDSFENNVVSVARKW